VNQGIFKACDIRGEYPKDFEAADFRAIGHAVGRRLGGGEILVGGDVRGSTPILAQALIEGLTAAGTHVLDAGMAPTPVLYFGKTHHQVQALAIVTASHNPSGHNGLKLMLSERPVTPADIQEIARLAEAAPGPSRAESVSRVDLRGAYREWLTSAAARPVRRARVVCDAGGGAFSELAPQLLEACGYDVVPLFCTPDPRLESRNPNCAVAANLGDLQATVRQHQADLGIAFDGDGDRVAFVDEGGRVVAADQAMLILLEDFGPALKGETMVYDIKCSMAVPEYVQAAGGDAAVEKSGHAFIKATMLERNALFGGEVSGHYFYRELHGGDDGLYSALRMARIASAESIAEKIERLPRYAITPDIRLACDDGGDKILAALQASYPGERLLLVDGVRVAFPGGWALARPSITENKITFRFEGRDESDLRHIVTDFCERLPALGDEIMARV